MTLVSHITIDAESLEHRGNDYQLFYINNGIDVPIIRNTNVLSSRMGNKKYIYRFQFYFIYQSKITLRAFINDNKYELDIKLDTYRDKYLLKLHKNGDEYSIYENL